MEKLDINIQLANNPDLIQDIEQTESNCFIAVSSSPHVLSLIKPENQTPKVIGKALSKDIFSIERVHKSHRTVELWNKVLRENGLTIKYLDNPSEEQCMIALKENPAAISCIKKQTAEMCLFALTRDKDAFRDIKIGKCKNIEESIKTLEELARIEKNKKSIISSIKKANQ